MPAATTIVVAREDFSIPGGEENNDGDNRGGLESRFFNLLREAKPDVVVLDLRQANGDGISHFVANPWEIQSRVRWSKRFTAKHPPATDRAIDVVVNRLRTKLRSVGEATPHLIKTEVRRGYRFVCDTLVERQAGPCP
jgi:hypothetical protein